MPQAIKTTMNFTPAFHWQLKKAAEEAGKPMAELVEEKLAPILTSQERARLKRMYAAFATITGICKEPVTDASSTIDEILYGKGHNQSQGGA